MAASTGPFCFAAVTEIERAPPTNSEGVAVERTMEFKEPARGATRVMKDMVVQWMDIGVQL